MAFRISDMLNCRSIAIFLLATASFIISLGTPSLAKTVTDQIGRNITVPDEPRRIVSLAPNITEIIFALGQEHRLVGVTRYSDFPPEAEKLPRVGSYVHLDLEKIVALKPDLCIAIKDGNPIAVAKRLESLKIPVYAVDPRNLETIMQTVLEIGGLINANKEADLLVQNMDLRIQSVSPIVSVGTHTFIHGLIVLAGGTNLAEGPIAYPRFSREQILALSPEVIIITSMARAAIFEQVKAEWNKWPHLPAVRNQRIFLEDSNFFDRPTPRLVDGLELLVRLIHPELFKEAE